MDKCCKYTIINCQPSIETLENLIESISKTFERTERAEDMFYYGVFFKPQNYVNFEFDEREKYDFDLPFALTAVCSKYDEKMDYVNSIIDKIMRKEIDKPEWMIYIEMNSKCGPCDEAPSTFLYIRPKEKKYEDISKSLTNFLYSPNLTITMFNA